MSRILVSAYACEPGKGSEPGVGWNWVCQIARFNEAWVVTRANNRRAIESALIRDPQPNLHWIYFDLPRWLSFWKKGIRGIQLYYLLWQIAIYFVARGLHRKVDFELVHHITFVNYWMPSFLVMLSVPFLLGPVGGGESAPPAFWWSFSLRGKVYETLRDLRRDLAHLDPFVRLAARRAVVALATTSQTGEKLRRLGCRNVSVISQVGVDLDEIRRRPTSTGRSGCLFRVVSVGRLLHWKGFEIGVRAFALLKAQFPASEYWLIGDGPERKRLEKLTRSLGLGDSVRFLGSMPRPLVLEKLAACHALLNPSLHDSGSFVCAEAMAAGLPVICLDLGGPSIHVTKETGIKIPAISPGQVILELAQAMRRLARDPGYRQQLGKAGRKRVGDFFAWEEKGDFIARLYGSILSDNCRHVC
ncbi:MAG: glycosyltransferase family 4 protein [Terriglobia bacterium]